ncbi:MAG: hypothetical protein ACLFUS_10695 [Candidatus Sumerlaeia bacterium]
MENEKNPSQPNEKAQSREEMPHGERRNVDRRSGDRRTGDRRRGGDRRLGDRRRGEAHGQDWRGRKIGAMQRRTKVLVAILVASVVVLLIDRFYTAEQARPTEPEVVVEVPGHGVYRCPIHTLAYHFATMAVIDQVEKNPNRLYPPQIRNDMIELRVQNILQKPDQLLEKVRDMPWKEFKARSRFLPKRGGSDEAPSEEELKKELGDARIE